MKNYLLSNQKKVFNMIKKWKIRNTSIKEHQNYPKLKYQLKNIKLICSDCYDFIQNSHKNEVS